MVLHERSAVAVIVIVIVIIVVVIVATAVITTAIISATTIASVIVVIIVPAATIYNGTTYDTADNAAEYFCCNITAAIAVPIAIIVVVAAVLHVLHSLYRLRVLIRRRYFLHWLVLLRVNLSGIFDYNVVS